MLHVGLIYGGHSSEHDISILSAKNVYAALNPEHYRVTPIRIDRSGRWRIEPNADALLAGHPEPGPEDTDAFFSPMDARGVAMRQGVLEHLALDVAIPMLHGQNGEDGTIQGFLQTLGVPYVGPGVLGSAICMDKAVAKCLLRDAGVPNTPFRLVLRHEIGAVSYDEVTAELGSPLFVKPANSGSSVGVSKVESADAFRAALESAFAFDHKVLIETGIDGREVECAILGNENPEASVPGEIVSDAVFYTYDAKYLDPDAARMVVPAELPAGVAERVRSMSLDAFRVLGCEGMARVDCFVMTDGTVLVNEVNTIPGFTSRSMYPVMWEKSGVPYGALIDRLIELAIARHRRDAALKTTRA